MLAHCQDFVAQLGHSFLVFIGKEIVQCLWNVVAEQFLSGRLGPGALQQHVLFCLYTAALASPLFPRDAGPAACLDAEAMGAETDARIGYPISLFDTGFRSVEWRWFQFRVQADIYSAEKETL